MHAVQVLTVAGGGFVPNTPKSIVKTTSVMSRVDVSTLASLAMKRRDVRQASWMCLMIPGAGDRGTGRGALNTGRRGGTTGAFSRRGHEPRRF